MTDKEKSIEELKAKIKEFCEEREWDQFHSPKELASIKKDLEKLLKLNHKGESL